MSDNKEKEVIIKTGNEDMATSRIPVGNIPSSIGYESLVHIQNHIERERNKACKWPEMLHTYDKMDSDPAVFQGHNTTQIMVEKAFKVWSVSTNAKSPQSIEAGEFIKHALNNMKTPLNQAIREAYVFKKYGFSVLVKNFSKIKPESEWGKKGYRIGLSKLSPRHPHSLDKREPFSIAEDGSVRSINQNTQYARSSYSSSYGTEPNKVGEKVGEKTLIPIRADRCLLFSYDSNGGDPMGTSPRKAAYKPHFEKAIIEDFTRVGVTKDLNGVPIIYIPSSILNAAAEDPSSPAGVMVQELQRNAADWFAGEQSHMILPSDVQEDANTIRQFDVKLAGIDGGGSKSYKTSELIEERYKAILNCYGAGFLLLGQDGVGSYALSDTQQGVHAFHVQNDVSFIEEVINHQLIPQLLKINGIVLSHEDMPKFVAGDIDERDLEIYSKGIQRMASVGMLPVTPELIQENLEATGSSYRLPDEVFESDEAWEEYKEKYLPESSSRSGDGMAVGKVNGTSDKTAGSDLNATNVES